MERLPTLPRPSHQKLTFISVGSAIDMPGANTSILYDGNKRLLIDCGYAVPLKFCSAFPDPDYLDGIYLSHQHADHSFGLPPLLAWMKAMGRTRPLRLLHGPDAEVWIHTLLDVGYPGSFSSPPCFPIEFFPLAPNASASWDETRFQVARSEHKVPNWSLRIDDNELAFAYSGDGSPSEATSALFQGTTHLVHECSWAEKIKDGHGDAADLLRRVQNWDVKNLHLVHVLMKHRENVLERVATFEGNTCVTVPSAGQVISLDV